MDVTGIRTPASRSAEVEHDSDGRVDRARLDVADGVGIRSDVALHGLGRRQRHGRKRPEEVLFVPIGGERAARHAEDPPGEPLAKRAVGFAVERHDRRAVVPGDRCQRSRPSSPSYATRARGRGTIVSGACKGFVALLLITAALCGPSPRRNRALSSSPSRPRLESLVDTSRSVKTSFREPTSPCTVISASTPSNR